MEIRPATFAQVARARNGQLIEISNDVGGVAIALRHIDEHICLRYSETGEYWVAYWKPHGWDDGSGYQITTAQDLDHRIVKRVEDIYAKCKQPGYSFAAELEKTEAQAKADAEYRKDQEQGAMLEQLAHALRKDLGYDKAKVAIGKGI